MQGFPILDNYLIANLFSLTIRTLVQTMNEHNYLWVMNLIRMYRLRGSSYSTQTSDLEICRPQWIP